MNASLIAGPRRHRCPCRTSTPVRVIIGEELHPPLRRPRRAERVGGSSPRHLSARLRRPHPLGGGTDQVTHTAGRTGRAQRTVGRAPRRRRRTDAPLCPAPPRAHAAAAGARAGPNQRSPVPCTKCGRDNSPPRASTASSPGRPCRARGGRRAGHGLVLVDAGVRAGTVGCSPSPVADLGPRHRAQVPREPQGSTRSSRAPPGLRLRSPHPAPPRNPVPPATPTCRTQRPSFFKASPCSGIASGPAWTDRSVFFTQPLGGVAWRDKCVPSRHDAP